MAIGPWAAPARIAIGVADRTSRRPAAPGSITIPHGRPSAGRVLQIGAVTGSDVAKSLVRRRQSGMRDAAVAGAGRAFSSLGPTFVKLGQMISANPMIFPESVTAAFRRCQDRVPPEPFSTVKEVIESEFDRPIAAMFATIEQTPVAAASIAQVHRAQLTDGTEVVVKVQRPGLRSRMSVDLAILSLAARSLVRVRPRYGVTNPEGVIEDFRVTLSEELSFVVEAERMDLMREVLADWPIAIARPIHDLTRQRVLTMERMEGVRPDDLAALEAKGHDRQRLADLLISSLLYSALQRGIFHGDGHPGNLVVLDDGRLGLYDFGIVGQLVDDDRRAVSRFFRGLILSRFDVMTEALTQLADLSHADLAGATNDIAQLQGGLFTAEGQIRLAEIDHGQMLSSFLDIANRHGMIIPTDLVLLFKQLLYLNGLANVLDPDLDVFDGERFFPHFALDDGWQS